MTLTASALLTPPDDAPSVRAFDGRVLTVEFVEGAVIDLQHQRSAGWRIEPVLRAPGGEVLSAEARRTLLASDLERVDALTLDRGLQRLQERGDPEATTLVLAVSFLTAASQRARMRLLGRAGAMAGALRASTIWLLTDLPLSAPAGRVAEVTALLRPLGRAVFAKPELSALKTLRGAGFAGLLAEPRNQALSEVDRALWLLQAGALLRKAAPALIAGGLSGPDAYAMAREAGFTHATLG